MLTLRNQNITINKQTLLNKIRENFAIYKTQIEDTQKDYQDLVRSHVAHLNDMLSQNIFDKDKLYFKISPPVDYSEKYETVIEMLEYSTTDTIELDSSAFKAYVKNQWDWTDSFNSYSASLKGNL